MFGLINAIIYIAIALIEMMATGAKSPESSIAGLIYLLATAVPTIAVSARRLHDRNMSGWWFLGCLLPILGNFIILALMIPKGTSGSNQYGPDPLAPITATE